MPRKSKRVKKAQSKSTIPKRKKTKVGKAKRKMKTRGRIVSRKGSKKKLLAYGNNSSSNSNNSNSQSHSLSSYMKYHLQAAEKDPNYFLKISGKSYNNI